MSDREVLELEREVEAARRHLAELELRLSTLRANAHPSAASAAAAAATPLHFSPSFISSAASLSRADVEQYSRQMLVDGIGAAGMDRIRRGRVLLVGAGGLGSTAALFLAAAGVGELRIVDFDRVERSNLHRQVIHTDERVGSLKAESARAACLALNPRAVVIAEPLALCPANAESLVRHCDVAVDASDNVAARYILCDAAARHGVPVVSGSALRWDAQLSVYSRGGGPCYRCLFPAPPPPVAVGSCGDSGVVGPVPGAVGCLQALETLKVLAGGDPGGDPGATGGDPGGPGAAGGGPGGAGGLTGLAGRLLLIGGRHGSARVVQLRGRRAECAACGDGAPPVAEAAAYRAEYGMTGGACGGGHAIPEESRMAPREAVERIREGKGHVMLLDVRPTAQFEMARLPGAVSLPVAQLHAWRDAGTLAEEWHKFTNAQQGEKVSDVFVICRRGISSTEAVAMLLPLQHSGEQRFVNIDGGLNRYSRDVDPGFPFY